MKREFEFNEDKYYVESPDHELHMSADAYHSQILRDCMSRGMPTRSEFHALLKDRQSPEQDMAKRTLAKEIADGEHKLHVGGIGKNAAKKIALDIIKKRNKLSTMSLDEFQLDTATAEGQADNARFTYLVAHSVYKEDGSRMFKDVEEWKLNSGSNFSMRCSQEFIALSMGLDEGRTDNIEVEFLKEFGFVDDEGRLLDKEGRLVDIDGNRVDEDGNLIDDAGHLIDVNGHRIDEQGNYVEERKGFFDDDVE